MSDQNKMLKDQRKKLDDDVRRNQRFVEILKGKAAKLNSEIDELVLRNSTAEQEMTTFRKSRETRMLEHDTLKLEVNKLKASLSSRSVNQPRYTDKLHIYMCDGDTQTLPSHK